jgi:hypothetical protein
LLTRRQRQMCIRDRLRGLYHKIFETFSFIVMKILQVHIITVSPIITEIVTQKGFTKILASANGIDEMYFKKPEGEPEKVYDIVYCGRLHKSKGIYRFVDVIQELHKKGNRVSAAILGSGPEELKLKEYVHARGLGEYVSVPGYVSDLTKRLIYTKAKAFLSASYEEGWGIAIGEALAMNVPVVSFRSKELEAVWGTSVIWTASVSDAAIKIQGVSGGVLDKEKVEKYTWNRVLAMEDTYVSTKHTYRDIVVLGSYGRGNIGDDVFLYAVQSIIDPKRVIINSAGVGRLPSDLVGQFETIETNFTKDFLHKLGVLRKARTIVYAGGDVWTLMYEDMVKRKHLYKMCIVNFVARILGKKIIYLGTGVGDLDGFSVWIAKISARLAQYIVFRDQE